MSKAEREEQERPRLVVVCAAVKLKSGRVVCGVRHFDQIMIQSMPENTEEGRVLMVGHEQGFVDNWYRFLNRAEAFNIVVSNGQLDIESSEYRGIKGTLFSEDLW